MVASASTERPGISTIKCRRLRPVVQLECANRPHPHARQRGNQCIAEVAFHKLGLRPRLQLIAADQVILARWAPLPPVRRLACCRKRCAGQGAVRNVRRFMKLSYRCPILSV